MPVVKKSIAPQIPQMENRNTLFDLHVLRPLQSLEAKVIDLETSLQNEELLEGEVCRATRTAFSAFHFAAISDGFMLEDFRDVFDSLLNRAVRAVTHDHFKNAIGDRIAEFKDFCSGAKTYKDHSVRDASRSDDDIEILID